MLMGLGFFIIMIGASWLSFVGWILFHFFYLADELLPGKWLTLEELIERGHRSLPCRIILCIFYRENMLEVRRLIPMDDDGDVALDTMEFYEFRLVYRPPRKEKKGEKENSFLPGWQPVPA